MHFHSKLDELEHWLGVLEVDVRLGVDKRHLISTSRLCFLLIEQIEKAGKPVRRLQFKALEIRLLDLQRAIGRVEPAKPSPRARTVGRLRVIEGGT